MARVTVHLHGVPKEKANRELIEMYSKRISSRGIRIEYHPDKMSVEAYQNILAKRKGTVIYLDEGGETLDSLELAPPPVGAGPRPCKVLRCPSAISILARHAGSHSHQ